MVRAGWRRLSLVVALMALALSVAGCGTGPPRIAVPAALASEASLPDMDDIRTWGDAPFSRTLLAAELPKLKAVYQAQAKSGRPLTADLLALSGGADDGAFGAGLIVGWGQRGNRPEFGLVTGISAGALIAPFAFLGREYDRQLAMVFTTYGSDQIYQANILPGLLGGSALADSSPLKHLIDRYVDARMLRRIAEERAKGRFLLVGTTNIDAQRPVYWDMGRIAQHGGSQSAELFRKVLLASAALPGLFPPVHFKVVAGGKHYEEMHVDGGATHGVFLSPAEFSFREIDRAVGVNVNRRLWVIRNGKLAPEYKVTNETTLAIAQRSLETLSRSQGIGDLARIYIKAKSDGMQFRMAYIPESFNAPRPAPFDNSYMKALFALGQKLGRDGYSWSDIPPEVAVAHAK
jgi:predicted acylesterase/phospholipase RssA